ncbi:unnamed protein product [Lactuca saligna]|uniref:DUF4371 domain-containing protein n=1 Tax=Lactuca saligna TaxID=75948 RepID=A0AA35UW39_LACSI|nr:unnamed protein product [Lactuca saligna]
MGGIDSFHHKAKENCEFLLKAKQSISAAFNKQTKIEESNYKLRLGASVWCCKFLLKNGLPFRGHDESSDSLNRGLFLDLLSFLRDHNEGLRNVTLENAPQNNQVTCPRTQKQIIECFSTEIILEICKEIGKDVFSLLVDESSDVSKKEQMVIVLRYVDNCGVVKERFIGVVHVKDTSSLTLKAAIDDVFTRQGYDGASNMRGAFNGLKALILQYNDSAYYVHLMGFTFQNHHKFDELIFGERIVKESSKKDQDILEAASLVRGTMDALKSLRDTGFAKLLSNVFSFCQKHDINIVEMKKNYVTSKGRKTKVTNQFHFKVEIFNTVMDMQIIEFGDRFSELSTQLLEYMGTLSPCDSFSKFNKTKLLKLSELYTKDFDDAERIQLDGELEIYYHVLHKYDRFTSLQEISDLSRLMVETGKHRSYPMVYRLLKLVLVLPVVTVVERCFSTMKFLKTDLRNKIGGVTKFTRIIKSIKNLSSLFRRWLNPAAATSLNLYCSLALKRYRTY